MSVTGHFSADQVILLLTPSNNTFVQDYEMTTVIYIHYIHILYIGTFTEYFHLSISSTAESFQ